MRPESSVAESAQIASLLPTERQDRLQNVREHSIWTLQAGGGTGLVRLPAPKSEIVRLSCRPALGTPGSRK